MPAWPEGSPAFLDVWDIADAAFLFRSAGLFNITATNASWTLADYSGTSNGGTALTIWGSGFCRGASGCRSLACDFRSSEVTGHTTVMQQCISGPYSGLPCGSNNDCGAGTCSDEITSASTPSKVVNNTALICIAPRWPFPATVTLLVISEHISGVKIPLGVTSGTGNGVFTVRATANSVLPAQIGASGGQTTLNISGTGFDTSSSTLRCVFTQSGFEATATAVSPQLIQCTAPGTSANVIAGDDVVQIFEQSDPIDSQSVLSFKQIPEWFGFGACVSPRPSSSSCSASSTSAYGNVNISIQGWGLNSSAAHECRFTDSKGNVQSARVFFVNVSSSRYSSVFVSVPQWSYPAGPTNASLFQFQNGAWTLIQAPAGPYGFSFLEAITSTDDNTIFFESGCPTTCWPLTITLRGFGFDPHSSQQVTPARKGAGACACV